MTNEVVLLLALTASDGRGRDRAALAEAAFPASGRYEAVLAVGGLPPVPGGTNPAPVLLGRFYTVKGTNQVAFKWPDGAATNALRIVPAKGAP